MTKSIESMTGRCLRYKSEDKDVLFCVIGRNSTSNEAADAVYLDPAKKLAGYKTIYPLCNGFLEKCEQITDRIVEDMFYQAIPDISFLINC